MNIIVTPETSINWSTVIANDIAAGVIMRVSYSGITTCEFHLYDSTHEQFSPLEIAQICHVGRKAAAVLTVTARLTP